jgi:hypothetical protein
MRRQATKFGEDLLRPCRHCGAVVPERVEVCPNCGANPRQSTLHPATESASPPRAAATHESQPIFQPIKPIGSGHDRRSVGDLNGARQWGLSRGGALILFGFAVAFGSYVSITQHDEAEVRWRAIMDRARLRATPPDAAKSTALAPLVNASPSEDNTSLPRQSIEHSQNIVTARNDEPDEASTASRPIAPMAGQNPSVSAAASVSPKPGVPATVSVSPKPGVPDTVSVSPKPSVPATATVSPKPGVPAASVSPRPSARAAAGVSPNPSVPATAEVSRKPRPAATAGVSPKPGVPATAGISPTPNHARASQPHLAQASNLQQSPRVHEHPHGQELGAAGTSAGICDKRHPSACAHRQIDKVEKAEDVATMPPGNTQPKPSREHVTREPSRVAAVHEPGRSATVSTAMASGALRKAPALEPTSGATEEPLVTASTPTRQPGLALFDRSLYRGH